MKTKFILVLGLAVNVALIAAIAWHHHTHSSLNARLADAGLTADDVLYTPDQLAEFGLAKGITPQEYRDAKNIFVQERQMWSKFNGMSADMSVEFEGDDGKRLSLEGNVSLRRLDLSEYDKQKRTIAKYDMTIFGKDGAWTAKTDGTPKNTRITGQNPQILESVKAIDPESILHILTFPQFVTATLYRDKLYPEAVNPFSLDKVLKIWKPWLMTNDIPHSYVFFASDEAQPDFAFKNGHFNRWRKMERVREQLTFTERLAIYFDNPKESGGFWYPTVFRMTPVPVPWPYPDMERGFFILKDSPTQAKSKGQLCIRLSNVSVNVK